MRDERTCERCAHLRVEHKLFGLPWKRATWARSYCWACDCPQFASEPDDDDVELLEMTEVA